jgi:mannose-1-phosphate guanylyltransferase/mannose-6-phosphate isomerase
MKIIPVILCGGAGTRLWPKSKNNQAKQFIDFGGWTLFERTLLRIKSKIYDSPVIVTNKSYLKLVKKYLLKHKLKKWFIILEPVKKNTNAAIASITAISLQNDIETDNNVPRVIFPSDHLIENSSKFNNSLKKNIKYLNNEDIFIFGIKPKHPSNQYGYFLTKKTSKGTDKVMRFIEKPTVTNAKKVIKKKGYWNSGIIFSTKMALWNSFYDHDPKTLETVHLACQKSKCKWITSRQGILYLNKKIFSKIKEKSFDYAILEKSKNINGIKLNIPWSDLGSWNEISNIYKKNKSKYLKKNNIFYRPWGKYINLYNGKGFLVKELIINSKSSISLQKHKHRSEYWTVTSGKPKITINKRKFFKKVNETVFIPQGAKHRIENLFKEPVKIMEVQTGAILKETDIVRYKDIYGRVN